MEQKGITSFARRLYLNLYACLLIALGAGILFLPLWRISWWAWALLCLPAGICLHGARNILRTWPDKKRKYALLMQRNADGFRPETFKDMMGAPCSRLLVRLVLKDLGQSAAYPALKRYRPSLRDEWAHGICRRQRTVVRMYDENGRVETF